jgi:hypothetical protein
MPHLGVGPERRALGEFRRSSREHRPEAATHLLSAMKILGRLSIARTKV